MTEFSRPLAQASASQTDEIPLSVYLVRLIGLSMLPLLLLAAGLAFHNVRSTQTDRDNDAATLTRHVASTVDQYLEARISALNMLAVSPLLDSTTGWPQLYREAQGFQQSFGSHVILANTDMQMLFNTRLPFGSALPKLPRPKGQAAAPLALASGKPAVGDTFIGPIAKELLVAIAVPALREEKAAFLLLTTFHTGLLQQHIEQMALPADWSLTLRDGRNEVIARRGPVEPNSAHDVDVAGRFIARSKVSAWSVVLEIPRTSYRSPLLNATLAMTIAILVATLASLLGGLRASRQLAREVAGLAETGAPDSVQAKIAEIGSVRRRLDTAEITASESESRFQATFEQAAVGIALVGPDGHWLQVNDKLCAIVGYSREELLACSFQDITHPDDLNRDLSKVEQMLKGELHSYTMEKRYLRKNGETVWINLSVALIRKADGQPDYFVSVVENIQARKDAERSLNETQAEINKEREQTRLAALNRMEDAIAARQQAEQANAALRESRERLQLFIEHAPASLAMFDHDMRYLAFSRRWLNDYSLGDRPIIGLSHYEVFPEISERWKEIHRRSLAGEVIRSDADCFERMDGSRMWLRWEVRPWHAADGSIGGIVVFSEDITQFKEAEDEIRQLNANLERRVAERTAELTAANKELDSFAYAVSHDLRAPLRALSGFSQALLEDYGQQLTGEARSYLDQICIASGKMGDLIDGILALSRSTRGDLHHDTVDLSALAAELLAELARAEPGRSVDIAIEPGLRLYGDSRMIEVVMRNLLGNAWKYTGKRSAPCIRVHAGEIDGQPAICVTDNGAGFDMAYAQQLFQPFRRLHRQDEFPGIGIGLATVQRIIHRHGGAIQAQGRPGAGATFCFSLAGEENAA